MRSKESSTNFGLHPCNEMPQIFAAAQIHKCTSGVSRHHQSRESKHNSHKTVKFSLFTPSRWPFVSDAESFHLGIGASKRGSTKGARAKPRVFLQPEPAKVLNPEMDDNGCATQERKGRQTDNNRNGCLDRCRSRKDNETIAFDLAHMV